MKTHVAILLSIALGLATGLGATVLQLNTAPWDGDPGGDAVDPPLPDLPEPGEPLPKLVVNQTRFDFGRLNLDKEGNHDFVFTNQGLGRLVLRPGRTSCGCVVAQFEENQIVVLPGRSTKVTVKYKPKEEPGPYEQTAEVNTNDPELRKVKLVITGKVTVAVKTVPSEVAFGRISAGESVARTVPVYCYLAEPPLEIQGHSFARNGIADHFEVTFGPLPSDQLEQEPDAQSGQLMRVTVKPGLPLGPIQQTIVLQTNLKTAASLEVPIVGSIGGELTVAGRGWNDETGVLEIGPVDSREGVQWRLILIARGEHHREVRFQPGPCRPDLLEVELGESFESADGKTTQTTLIIRIPKGSPGGSYLGTGPGEIGRIVVHTTHPQIPELRIPVSFAILD